MNRPSYGQKHQLIANEEICKVFMQRTFNWDIVPTKTLYSNKISDQAHKKLTTFRLLAATTLRNVLGTKNLGDILSERESIAQEMQVGFPLLGVWNLRNIFSELPSSNLESENCLDRRRTPRKQGFLTAFHLQEKKLRLY